ncbi:hypothetical protein L6270_04140 [Candidatus Parcubacteria bacterium]|nr:hypothetical protein [Patescibacteria group bacterium]MBU4309153.1 hypothetical protein [Patescibacteria group bacterium]MBU4432676.1 hypothetical protein [Patescibacteria group bacterium]MBU4577514.1 hypothetical protein [Patescibacteria group bacterium]MCG2697201.1 hypothetical protein [Candidatus Parcubacteria bacterium]
MATFKEILKRLWVLSRYYSAVFFSTCFACIPLFLGYNSLYPRGIMVFGRNTQVFEIFGLAIMLFSFIVSLVYTWLSYKPAKDIQLKEHVCIN